MGGLMLPAYQELSVILGVDVVGFEYTGYGPASGAKLATTNLNEDADAAYELLLRSGVPASRIVAYGQSIGSAPACHLASKRPLAGLILHSALASALKVIDPKPEACCRPSCAVTCLDTFHNDRAIRSVTCPVLIMHGRMDEIVPFRNAEYLHAQLQPRARWPPYYSPEAGHNDLMETDPASYFQELSDFLTEVQSRIGDGEEGPSLSPRGDAKPAQARMSPPGSGRSIQMQDMWDTMERGVGKCEARIGPDDGRYQRLRQGDVLSGVPLGRATRDVPP